MNKKKSVIKTDLIYTVILSIFLVLGFLITPFALSKNKKSKPSINNTKSVQKILQRKINIGESKVTKAPQKEVHVIMNDPLMKKKWDLQKTNVKEAWLKFSKGNRNIVVAVIDTGIDVNHPDLKANIWKNPKEIPGNNIDDDGNCYIDDIHGWNFCSQKYKSNKQE